MRIIIPQVLIVITKNNLGSVNFELGLTGNIYAIGNFVSFWDALDVTWSIKVETKWRQAFLDKHFWGFSMYEHGRLLFQYNLIFVGGLLVQHIFLLVCVSKAEAGLWALEWKSSSASNQQNLRKIKDIVLEDEPTLILLINISRTAISFKNSTSYMDTPFFIFPKWRFVSITLIVFINMWRYFPY